MKIMEDKFRKTASAVNHGGYDFITVLPWKDSKIWFRVDLETDQSYVTKMSSTHYLNETSKLIVSFRY